MARTKLNEAQLIYGLLKQRQGGTTGDATWQTAGTSNTDTSAKGILVQAGSNTSSTTSGTDVTVTFPQAFTQAPLVFLTVQTANGSNLFVTANTITTTSFKFRQLTGSSAETVAWLAIGQ